MRFLLISLFALFLLMPTFVLADAQNPGTCTSTAKTETDVGVFMVGICGECWDEGNCSLSDIMTVVANIGNFILSIVGSAVLVVYIIGGFWWIASHGDQGWVTKGKKWITSATYGLIIVLFAYMAIFALQAALTTGTVSQPTWVICDGTNPGATCGIDMECSTDGICFPKTTSTTTP